MKKFPVLVVLFLFMMLAGCSGVTTSPVMQGDEEVLEPLKSGSSHQVLGFYSLTVNSNDEIKVLPVRAGEYHINGYSFLMSPSCIDCLKILLQSKVGDVWSFEVTIKNGTIYTGYDTRITLLELDGMELLEPSSYTKVFALSGDVDPINPFVIFESGTGNNKWAPSATGSSTVKLKKPAAASFGNIIFAVDASFPGNEADPCIITNIQCLPGSIHNDGTDDVVISLDVYDWQGDIDNVKINLFPIGGPSAQPFLKGFGNFYYLEGIICDDDSVAPGFYNLLIEATSQGFSTYNYVQIEIIQGIPGTTLAETPCPKWRYDRKNTGRSAYSGPVVEPSEVWTVALPQLMAPTTTPNGTFVAGEVWGSKLYGISPTGLIEWQLPIDGWTHTDATICKNGDFFMGTGGAIINYPPVPGTLYSISQEGTINWTKVSQSGWRDCCVSISANGDTLYVGDRGGKFYALDPFDGSEIWTFQTGGEIMSSPAVADDGTIYFGSIDNKLYALNPSGTKKWDFVTGGDIMASPAIADDGTIYIGSTDKKLYALDPSGSQDWSLNLGRLIWSSVAIGSNGTLYVGSGINGSPSTIGFLTAINPNGSISWSQQLPYGPGTASPVVDASGNIFMATVGWGNVGLGGFLVAYSPSGTLLWSKLFNGWNREIAILPEGQIAVVTNCANLGSGGLTLFQ